MQYKCTVARIGSKLSRRTRTQCWDRWHNVLDCSINQVNGRAGTLAVAPVHPVTAAASSSNAWAFRAPGCVWIPEEGAKLIDAVEKLGEDWFAVAALVETRTKKYCRQRWVKTLDPGEGWM
jgi:hypothetical protein